MRMHLSSAVKHWGQYSGDRIAIESDSSTSYRELDSAAEFVLKQITLQGDNYPLIGVSVKKKALLIAAIIGCSRAGRTYVLIDPNNNKPYIETIEKVSGQIPLITDNPADSSSYLLKIVINEESFEYNDYEHQQYNVVPDEDACIIFTSGTTGTPKGIVRNNYSLLSEGLLWIIELGITQNARVMVSRSLFWTGGFVFMYATLFCGGVLVVSENDDEIELIYRAKKRPVSIAFIVPSQILNLIKNPIDSVKYFTKSVITMGAPISADTKRKFSNMYGCSIVEAWGNSEGLGTITDVKDLDIRPNSIGRPCFCDSMDIIDKNGMSCHPGEHGFLVGQSDNQYDRYLHDLESSLNTMDLRVISSEDIGLKDKSGYFYILGRDKEKIVIDNKEIFPSHIEKIALGHSNINDAALVFDSSERVAGQLLLLVVINNDEDLNMLTGWINDHLPDSQQIAKIISIEHIPRNQGGKIERDQVKIIYENLYQSDGVWSAE